MDRLAHKFETMRAARARARRSSTPTGAKIGFIAFGTSRLRRAREPRPACATSTASRPATCACKAYPFTAELRGVHPPPRARLRGRPEPRRAAAGADAAGSGRRQTSPSCAACATTAACRSTRAPSPTKSSARRAIMSTTAHAAAEEGQPHRAGGPELQGRQDHAVRRLRPQRHLRAHRRVLLRAWASSPGSVAKFSGIGCSSKSPAYFLGLLARLQRRARPHARRRHRRAARQPQPAWASASPATATPPPSASASSCTCCAATCR